VHGDDVPNSACIEELADFPVLRVETVHERLHETYLVSFTGFHYPPVVLQAAYQWLLAEDIFAGIRRCDDPVCVQTIGKRQVDGLDVRVGEELFMRPV
jgi:hypothetical protein